MSHPLILVQPGNKLAYPVSYSCGEGTAISLLLFAVFLMAGNWFENPLLDLGT